jgi:hypothetical protein
MFVVGIFSSSISYLYIYHQPHSAHAALRERERERRAADGRDGKHKSSSIAKASRQVFALAENLQIFVVDVDI